jgi:DNA-binding winged helix-turn-helix (wHTH) protein
MEATMYALARPLLILMERGAPRRQWVIEQPDILVGRSEECDIRLLNRAVSRRHARVVQTESGYVLTDLGSKNGTFVNGQQVEGSYILTDGDEIQIALAVRVLFVGAEATAPLEIGASMVRPQGLSLDTEECRVWISNREIVPPLSPAQFSLLESLYRREGRVVSREEVVAAVWPQTAAEGVSDQAIDALVRRLRERLRQLDRTHQYVVTVRGHGFRFENRSPEEYLRPVPSDDPR